MKIRLVGEELSLLDERWCLRKHVSDAVRLLKERCKWAAKNMTGGFYGALTPWSAVF